MENIEELGDLSDVLSNTSFETQLLDDDYQGLEHLDLSDIFSDKSYEHQRLEDDRQELKDILDKVSNKSEIEHLDLSNVSIIELNQCIFRQFGNIIDLNLSNASITRFENGVFDNLQNLTSINLSNNAIGIIPSNVFDKNTNLLVINLENNYLEWINKRAFSKLVNLKILNLSYNFIVVLTGNCLCCGNLIELYLNSNAIETIVEDTFNQLPNLVHLALNDNNLEDVSKNALLETKQLRHLNLDNNRIVLIEPNWLLDELTDLDLSDNKINAVSSKAFHGCPKLKNLKLTVMKTFSARSLLKLTSLTKFELNLKAEKKVNINSKFWKNFISISQLVSLKLVFQNIAELNAFHFSNWKHLEQLHLECIKPKMNRMIKFGFAKQLRNLPKLKKVVLKRLNSFSIVGYWLSSDKNNVNVNYLDLTGIKQIPDNLFFLFLEHLEYLNLSFSQMEVICNDAFKNLINLKFLNMECSKLKLIQFDLFKNTVKMEVLNVSNCPIEVIQDFSFQNLSNLHTLNLRNNNFLTITENTFSGLNNQTRVLFQIDRMLINQHNR